MSRFIVADKAFVGKVKRPLHLFIRTMRKESPNPCKNTIHTKGGSLH